jgi:hypothetical protein
MLIRDHVVEELAENKIKHTCRRKRHQGLVVAIKKL